MNLLDRTGYSFAPQDVELESFAARNLLRESPAFAKPITLYAPHTRGAQQYRALAEELMNHERQGS